jgi:hypothetical protein
LKQSVIENIRIYMISRTYTGPHIRSIFDNKRVKLEELRTLGWQEWRP